ncbi:MAG: P-type conjugative transfer protein TrbG [Coxiellaceae bacterium]|nr:P-type conjugative transfer protein TrbG [Coxiellaceae bacterium]
MNAVQKIVLISLCSILLCACETTKSSKDNSSYSLAINTRSSIQRTKYIPVPMPGQLMSLKRFKNSEQLVGEAAIEAANKKAMKQPHSGEYINSIMHFNYMPGALYQIYSAPLNVTDIQFQNNEHIVAVGAGDTLRWQVSKTYSGIGANRQEHLLIKPMDEGLSNSLVVTTDQRTYHLMLHSTPKTYMASVTWRYPESDGLVTKFEDAESSIDDITSGVDLNKLSFNYQVKLIRGPQPDWYPRMVFTDGGKTYIKFSSQIQDVPTLFIGDNKSNQITNYRVHGNYYIVDNVVYQAQLRGGTKNQIIVQISMKSR